VIVIKTVLDWGYCINAQMLQYFSTMWNVIARHFDRNSAVGLGWVSVSLFYFCRLIDALKSLNIIK